MNIPLPLVVPYHLLIEKEVQACFLTNTYGVVQSCHKIRALPFLQHTLPMLTKMPFEASPKPQPKLFRGRYKSSRRRVPSSVMDKPPPRMEFYSIQAAEQASVLLPKRHKTTTSKKTVTFREDANIVHDAPASYAFVNPKDVWFTRREIEAIRHRYRDYLIALQMEHKQQSLSTSIPSTLRIWYRAYQKCCSAKESHIDIYPISDIHAIGAERWAIPNILKDNLIRRRNLLHVVLTPTHPEHMAKMCRSLSRPSRRYATYVAALWMNEPN